MIFNVTGYDNPLANINEFFYEQELSFRQAVHELDMSILTDKYTALQEGLLGRKDKQAQAPSVSEHIRRFMHIMIDKIKLVIRKIEEAFTSFFKKNISKSKKKIGLKKKNSSVAKGKEIIEKIKALVNGNDNIDEIKNKVISMKDDFMNAAKSVLDWIDKEEKDEDIGIESEEDYQKEETKK